MKIWIGGTKLKVRSRTHDLDFAMTSLGGELDSLEGPLPREFAGTVIDAGGCIGAASIALRRLFPQAKIVCIEPSSENLKILRYNLRNKINLEIFHGALMGEVETFSFLLGVPVSGAIPHRQCRIPHASRQSYLRPCRG